MPDPDLLNLLNNVEMRQNSKLSMKFKMVGSHTPRDGSYKMVGGWPLSKMKEYLEDGHAKAKGSSRWIPRRGWPKAEGRMDGWMCHN